MASGGWVISILMYRKTETKFVKLVRVRKNQLDWLRENKDTKTIAGFLDKIINDYRYEKNN